MEELAKIIHQEMNMFWKCYKTHLLEDQEEDFWNNWIADLDKMDEGLKNNPVAYKLYLGMVKGFADATSEHMRK